MKIRRDFDTDERAELWRRWKLGESIAEIGRALERERPVVWGVLQRDGGYQPRTRHRSTRSLSLSDREEISRGLARGESFTGIAKRLGRSPSTISREVARNGGPDRYRASVADQVALERALRPKRCKLALNNHLRRVVAFKLSLNWSPQQITGWLKLRYPADDTMRISHETIYRSLFVQARGVLKKELLAHLRSGRIMRRPMNAAAEARRRSLIQDAVPISERPAEVEDRAVPGHWEGDLIVGANRTYVATLVERSSRFTMLVKLDAKDTATVTAALKKRITTLPAELRRSLTWDRGMELAAHKDFSVATDVDVYFCDPASPWQRGSNENTNGLLRQYFPAGTNLKAFSQAELNKVARELNERPRKTLGFRNPAEVFNAALQ